VVIIRGKVNAKDRDGNLTDEVKVLADDAREVTHEQAAAYQTTGRKQRTLKTLKGTKKLAAAVAAAKAERVAESAPKRLYIRLSSSENNDLLASLKQVIDAAPGQHEIVLVLGPDSAKQAVKLPGGIADDEETTKRLHQLVGPENVKLQ
jgi:hypothetical protein